MRMGAKLITIVIAVAGFLFFGSAFADPVPISTADAELPRLWRDIQTALTKKGYDPGPIDGEFGSKTSAAFKKFQIDNDIDDADTTKTLEALGVTLWKACFWLGQELKCPLGCSSSILATESRVLGYTVSCPGYDPTDIPLP